MWAAASGRSTADLYRQVALGRRFDNLAAFRDSNTGDDWIIVNRFDTAEKGEAKYKKVGTGGTPTTPGNELDDIVAGAFTNAAGNVYQLVFDDRVNPFIMGSIGDGVAADFDAIQKQVEYLEANGGGELVLPAATYDCDDQTLVISGANVTIRGYGATLLNCRVQIADTATDSAIIGFRVLHTGSNASFYLLEVKGTGFLIEDVTIKKAPDAGGVMIYFRRQCSFGTVRGLKSFGSNGFFISGHDITFDGCEVESKGIDGVSGTDDAYVMKAGDSTNPSVQTYNITITGGTVRGFYNIVAIGTEIGQYAVDGDYSNYVRNITVTGVNAYNCVTLGYVKPGAGSGDYRHGMVEDITISDCHLHDTLGMINWAFDVRAGRGAIVRNVNVSDCTVTGRCNGTSVAHAIIQITGMNLGASATIEDVTFTDITGRDRFDGVANSGPTPGEPFDWCIRIVRTSAANDIIRNVKFKNVRQRGTEHGAVVFENDPQGPFDFDDCDFLEIGANPPAGSYRGILGLTSSTIARFKETVIEAAASQLPAGATTFSCIGDVDTVLIGSAAAGANLTVPAWIAPANAYVFKIELIDGTGIAQDDTNYLTITARNMTAAADLPAVNTRVTGGINLAASTVVALQSASYTTTPAYFAKNSVLRLAFVNSGTGQPVSNMKARIHYLKYGR